MSDVYEIKQPSELLITINLAEGGYSAEQIKTILRFTSEVPVDVIEKSECAYESEYQTNEVK